MRSSLTGRIISLSVIWIVIALLAAGLVLTRLYRLHIEEHYDAHVFTHIEELIAAIETGPEGSLRLSWKPTDPNFYRFGSGWYWEIRDAGRVLKKSASLGAESLDLSGISLTENRIVRILTGPLGHKLRTQIIHVPYPYGSGSLVFATTAPDMQIADDVKDFGRHLMTSFLVLGIGFSIAVIVQVAVALRPLKAIRSAIGDIKAGKSERLPDHFPNDVQPLVDELNFLLDHDRKLLTKAREQLGDLAHAVKNPLAVIRNEARNIPNEQGQLILDQSHAMSSSIDHYLSSARVYGEKDVLGFRTAVLPVIEDLRFAVTHIYRERGIDISFSCPEEAWFRGDSQDLEEVAGNLIENACKWAQSKVRIHCWTDNDLLRLTVEDDGPGIAKENYEWALTRGRKLDDKAPGHGHGLAIVKDIAELYGGSLTLGRSKLGGLKAELNLPAA